MSKMAERDRGLYEIYWTRDESVDNTSNSEAAIHAFAPGVDRRGNKRPTQKVQPERPRGVPGRAGRDGRMTEHDRTLARHKRRKENDVQETKTSAVIEAVRLKDKPSLKDLRPEDKKRIANLIRELAKVGEEKEVIVQQLNVERRSYEDSMEKLHRQMTAIVQDRELTQKQYLECQKLLAEYQSQLASEQEKLAASFHLPSSPLKHNAAPQSVTKPMQDNVPTAKNQSFTHPSQRMPSATNQDPTRQNSTPAHLKEHPSASHQDGYQYPVTHHKAPSRKQVHHPTPGVHQPQPGVHQPSIGAYRGRTDWNQLPGTQHHPPPSTQHHPPPSTQHHPPPSTQLPHSPSDLEFNPLLASTHRPNKANGSSNNANWTWQGPMPAGNSEPTMYVSYGNMQNPRGYVLRPGLDPEQGIHLPQTSTSYPSDSQEMLPSRAQSGDFQPLQPELEMDYESQGSNSPEYTAGLHNNDYVHPASVTAGSRFQVFFQGDRSRTDIDPQGPWNQLQDAGTQHAGAQQPVYRTSAECRHAVLERQRRKLRDEQAWLQQKLRDQEELLLQKQSQLEQHRLHQLERERQRHHSDHQQEQEWQRDHSTYIPHTSIPRMDEIDREWEEPHIFNGTRHGASSGSENDNDNIGVSTNFPPESFTNQPQPTHTFENCLRRTNLNHSGDDHNDRSRGMPHVRGAAMTMGDQNQPQARKRGEVFGGYASLYPETRARHKIQGSTSSCSPSTSSSANSQPALVDRSTSPLYRDRSAAPSDGATVGTARSPGRGRLGLSPGRVSVTPAPQRTRSREMGTMRQEQRHPERRAVSLPRSPRLHSNKTAARKSNVIHLSDLVAEMESSPSTTRAKPVITTQNTTQNTSAVRLSYRTTPDLFQEDATYTNTDDEMQESRILEDVFFL